MPYAYNSRHYGDYYRGDYYRGDPFLGGLLSLGSKAFGVAKAVVGAVRGKKSVPAPTPPITMGTAGQQLVPFISPQARDIGVKITGPFGFGGQIGAFGPAQIGPGAPGMPAMALGPGTALACPIKGYRLNKSDYWTKSQGFIPKGTKCVKSRRMNVANPRALRRGLRRAYGFKKLAMRTLRLLSPTKPKRFAGFKGKGRSK